VGATLAKTGGNSYLYIMTNATTAYGYVYKTTNVLNGRIYIGKKAYKHKIKKKLTKKELAALPKGSRKKIKYILKDSGWETYYGSCKELQDDIKAKGKENFKVELIKECYSRKSLSYWEVYYQFHYNVLQRDSYNGNIMGRFYRKDII
jgi:hypothetical protein